MIQRILEPELMDTAEDAREYDTMDHAAVNKQFVTDLLNAAGNHADWSLQRRAIHVLDLGAGTALIPIELCKRAPNVHVTAIDAAQHMLSFGRKNVECTGLTDRIKLVHGDAKTLSFPPSYFDVAISNSILHHIPEPAQVIAEAIRVAVPGALMFHRDLCRPSEDAEVDRLVATYAPGATPYQRKLLADSLQAALTLEEIRALVAKFGFAAETVQMNSDRHWTWTARKL